MILTSNVMLASTEHLISDIYIESFLSLSRSSKESIQVRGSVRFFVTSLFLWWRVVSPHTLPPNWKTTPCCLSAVAYSIYSQLTSIAGGRSSIRNPRTRHAVGTVSNIYFCKYYSPRNYWVFRLRPSPDILELENYKTRGHKQIHFPKRCVF
jgi:hypothetical protein